MLVVFFFWHFNIYISMYIYIFIYIYMYVNDSSDRQRVLLLGGSVSHRPTPSSLSQPSAPL